MMEMDKAFNLHPTRSAIPGKITRLAGLLAGVALWFIGAVSLLGQTSAPVIQPRIIGPGGQIIIQPGVNVLQPSLDPQMAALMQQAGMDQTVTVKAEFDPPVIALGQTATYRVVVTAMIEGVALPDKPPTPPGLQLSFAGRGFQYGTGGGLMQPRTTVNYRVSVTAPGNYVMPSFTGSANGKDVKVPEARLQVLPANAPTSVAATARLVIEVPEQEFYIGQAIPVRLVLLDPGNNTVQAISQPQILGEAFISEPVPTRYRREFRPTEGRVLSAHINEVTAFPIKEGKLEFSAQAYAHVRRASSNPLAPQVLESVLMSSEPVTVTVKHLPKEGELPGFTGAIGMFAVEPPKPSTNTVRAGEPLTLTVTVRGQGNLTRLVPPKIERVRGWQAFPPMPDASPPYVIQQQNATHFTYTLIPINARVTTTPAIPFSYFDPAQKTYVDLTIPPVPITVMAAPGGTVATAEIAKVSAPGFDESDSFPGERELMLTGLAETPGRRGNLRPMQDRPWFLLLQLVPAAALGGLWAWDRRRRYLAEHPEVVLKARARRGLKRQLRRARAAAAARDAAGFVTAAVNAMREACAPLASANPDALVCADVLQALVPVERDGREGIVVRTLFSAADALRFVERTPDGVALLKLQPDLELLLAKWRARL